MLSASSDIIVYLSGLIFIPHFLQDAFTSFLEVFNFSKIVEINVASSASVVSVDKQI